MFCMTQFVTLVRFPIEKFFLNSWVDVSIQVITLKEKKKKIFFFQKLLSLNNVFESHISFGLCKESVRSPFVLLQLSYNNFLFWKRLTIYIL